MSNESLATALDSKEIVEKPKTEARNLKAILARIAATDAETRQEHMAKALRGWRGMALFTLVPLFLVSAYYLFWVSDRFVSTTQLIVKKNDTDSGASSSLSLLVPGVGSDSQDAYLVVNYIHSLDMALYLDKETGLRSYYQSHNYDIFSRLTQDATQEDYLDYYREHVTVSFDEQTGIITLEAQAYEPEFAQRLVEVMTKKSEDFVNSISNQLAEKQVEFVRKELDLSKQKLRNAKQTVLDFQNRNNVVSPEGLTQGISAIIQNLESRVSELRAKLTASKTYLNAGSSQVVSIKTEIDALEQQIEQEKLKLVGSSKEGNEQRLNSLTASFQNLQLDLQFGMDAYKAALKALETARMEASGKLKHLMVVSQPSLAEEPEYPHKLYNLVSLAVVLLLLYGIVKMLIASVRDHRI